MSRFISHILVCNVHDIFRAKNKKMIERSYKQSAEAEGLTKNIATSLSDANSKLSVSTADQANNRGKFETYINDLTITTQKKYEEMTDIEGNKQKTIVPVQIPVMEVFCSECLPSGITHLLIPM